MRPATGLTWAFEQVDRAIVLEDDCVPDPTFFPFCDEILERYVDDERVMHIAGQQLSGRSSFWKHELFFFPPQYLPRRLGHMGPRLAALRY